MVYSVCIPLLVHQTETVPGAANLGLMAHESAELVENDNLVSHDWVLTLSNYYLTFSRFLYRIPYIEGLSRRSWEKTKGLSRWIKLF